MYGGTLVETGDATTLFREPRHPYTLGLLQSVPRLDAGRRQQLQPIEGQPRNVLSELRSCPFEPRCRYRIEPCAVERPSLDRIERDHDAACFNPVAPDAWSSSRAPGAA